MIFLLTSCKAHLENEKSADSILNINVEPVVLDSVNKSIKGLTELPIVKTHFNRISIDETFEILTGEHIDNSYQVISTKLPDNTGTYSSIIKGDKPFYDMILDVESINTGTNINYYTKKYSYIDAVFYINDNQDCLTEEALYFCSPQNAKEQILNLLSNYETEIINLKCYALSSDALQKLYDTRKSTGTLRDERYGIGNLTVKNASSIAEKSIWNSSDACYILEGNISLCGVPVYGGEIKACIDSSGIIMFSATSLLDVKTEGLFSPLQSVESVLIEIDNISRKMYSEDKIKLIDLSLWFYPVDEKTYQPLWKATLEYTYTNPEQVKEIRLSEIWINAFSGEETVVGGQNSDFF